MPYEDIYPIDWILRHAIVPSHMIPWPKIPHRVLHKVRKREVGWFWAVYVDFGEGVEGIKMG
jgi:hypothetical protein